MSIILDNAAGVTQVDIQVVPSRPAKIIGFNLTAGCTVTIDETLWQYTTPHTSGGTCKIVIPSDAIMLASAPYQACCGVNAILDDQRNSIVIKRPGIYRLTLTGECPLARVALYEIADGNYEPHPAEMGCCPEGSAAPTFDLCQGLQSLPSATQNGFAIVGINNSTQCVTVDASTLAPAQTINGSPIAPVVGGGWTFQSNGQNDIIATWDNAQFCLDVQSCVNRAWMQIAGPGALTVNIHARRGIIVDASAGNVNVLLTVGSFNNTDFRVKRIDQTANTVTVVYSGGTIDGAPSLPLLGVPAIPGLLHGEGIHLEYSSLTPTNLMIV
jgi:hypothetical protein